MNPNGLNAVPLPKFPSQVFARDKFSQSGMEGDDMIVFKINLDEGFPVVIAIMDFNMVELVAFKLQVISYTKVFNWVIFLLGNWWILFRLRRIIWH